MAKKSAPRVVGLVTKSYRYLGNHNKGERVSLPLDQVAEHEKRGVKIVSKSFEQDELKEFSQNGGNLSGFLTERGLWLSGPVQSKDSPPTAAEDAETKAARKTAKSVEKASVAIKQAELAAALKAGEKAAQDAK